MNGRIKICMVRLMKATYKKSLIMGYIMDYANARVYIRLTFKTGSISTGAESHKMKE